MAKHRLPVDVKCPRCGDIVGEYRDILHTDMTYSCGKCQLLLVYIRDDKAVKIKHCKDQDRIASSGRRFL